MPITQVSGLSMGEQKCTSTCQEERCWEPPGPPGKGGLIQAVLIKPDNATELAWLSQERGKDGLGRRASLPPKSMSLLTWAEENLTALETCPSDEKEEAEKRLEPEKAPGCRRDQLPVGDPVASRLCCAFTEAQEDRCCCCPSPYGLPSWS